MTEQRTIAFTGMTGRLDVPSFVLSENSDLRIMLDLSDLKNKSGLFRLFVRHGGAPVYTFAFTQKEPAVTLPCEWLKQGGTEYLEFSLKQYNDAGTTLINGGYMIDPCMVTVEEGCFAVTSVIQELIDKVSALREELNAALETHRNAVASDLAGFEEGLEKERAEAAEARERLEGETASRLAGMDEAVFELKAGYETLQEIVSGLPAAIEEAKRQAVIEAAGGDPMGA